MNNPEVIHNLAKIGFSLSDTLTLARLSRSICRINEAQSNGFRTDADELNAHKRKSRLRAKVRTLVSKYRRLSVYFQNDPRGVAVYVYVKHTLRTRYPNGTSIDCVYSPIGVAVY